MSGEGLTHLDSQGRPQMVDVSAKDVSARVAMAEGRDLHVAVDAERIAQRHPLVGDQGDQRILGGAGFGELGHGYPI